MAIVNRTLDPTEKNKVMSISSDADVLTGTTLFIGIVPWPSQLQCGQLACFGVSGAPTFQVSVNRFIVGTGVTTWILATGTSNVARDIGTSGVGNSVGQSGIIFSGASLLTLQANDVLYVVQAGGAAAATKGFALSLILQPTVDIKYNFGLGI